MHAMKRTYAYLLGAALLLYLLPPGCAEAIPEQAAEAGAAPRLFPDYGGLVIPCNLAPLNFRIEEAGERFYVRIAAEKGKAIEIAQSAPDVRIPFRKWKRLLQENKGADVCIDVCVYNGSWQRFRSLRNRVAAEPINPYLYYRDIAPTNSLWNRMAMSQRNLENFAEEKIIDNYRIGHDCVNCHTFNKNNPEEMLFHIRGNHGGTLICKDGKIEKIEFPSSVASAGAYCDWHPEGRLIAFAVNKIKQNYYLSGYGGKMKEVFDAESDVVLYDTQERTLRSYPQLADPGRRENLPCWSADGKRLYFVSAKAYAAGMTNEEQQYSLMQADYEPGSRRLSEPEVVLSADSLLGSISFPTVSPDGKFMIFCLADFGYFPVNNKSSDLYLMDLGRGTYRKLPVNSPESESYVSWSDNSRWFVFSSRRLDGMTSKPYICHIDSAGEVSKPFLVPQKDGAYYRTDHRNFSRPELLKKRFPIAFGRMRKAIFSEPLAAKHVTY
jgi:hypothetical protein